MPRSTPNRPNGFVPAARLLGGGRPLSRSLSVALALAGPAIAVAALFFSFPGAVAAKDDPAGPTSREEKSRAAIDALVQDLGSDEFDTREAATESLIALGSAARPALEAARGSADPEVRARAERCLRAIDGGAESADDDDAADAGAGDSRRRVRSRLPRGRRLEIGPFEDPTELIERLEREFREGARFSPFLDPKKFDWGHGLGGAGSSVRIRIEEDGRSWTYTEDPEKGVEARVPGESSNEEVITAPDRATFVKANPELAKKFGLDESASPQSGLAERGSRLRGNFRFAPLRPSGPRLGVAVEPVGDALARPLRLPDDARGGVVVLEVEGGSAADSLGLEPDDVILSLNGVPCGDAAALRGAARGLEPGDEIEIEIVRGGERRLLEGRY